MRRKPQKGNACGIEALDILETEAALLVDDEPLLSLYEDELLEASQQKYSYAAIALLLLFSEAMSANENKTIP